MRNRPCGPRFVSLRRSRNQKPGTESDVRFGAKKLKESGKKDGIVGHAERDMAKTSRRTVVSMSWSGCGGRDGHTKACKQEQQPPHATEAVREKSV